MFLSTTRIDNAYSGEDRLACVRTPMGSRIVVADGAGGIGGGANASARACEMLSAVAADACGDPSLWVQALVALDASLVREGHGGQTTLVVVEVFARTIVGASVGDSCAVLVEAGHITELTVAQNRRPLVGSGACVPTGFGPIPFEGRLLVGTDGLFSYARFDAISRVAAVGTLDSAADALLDLARLSSGRFHDDVGFLLGVSASEPVSDRQKPPASSPP